MAAIRWRSLNPDSRIGHELLFVYGTLRPLAGHPVARWLRTVARPAGEATVPGRLYDLGAYPGMVDAGRAGECVVGDLYRLCTPRATLNRLDRYENTAVGSTGHRFVRVRREAVDTAGTPRTVWLYLFHGVVAVRPRIVSGDYLGRSRRPVRRAGSAPG